MQTVKLSDVCTIVSGSTPKTDEPAFWNGTLKWVTPAELRDDTIFVTDTERHITEAAARSAHLTPFPAGTVLLSSRAPIGKTAIAGAEMYCNQGFKNLICSDRINNRYLYYFLTSRTRYLNDLGRGATFKEISKTIVENIEIPLPPLAEQQRIVRELQQVGALLANRRQVDEQLAELPKARFVEMFGDLAFNPHGWKSIPIADLCAASDDIKCGPFGTQLSQSEYITSGVPVWGIPQVNANFQLPTKDFITSEKAKKLSSYTLIPGDIVMSRKGNVGRCAVYPQNFPFGILHSDVLRIRVNREVCDPTFLMQQLHDSRVVQTQIEVISNGAIMAGLNVTKLKSLCVHLPPLPAQRRFAAFARACAAQRAACARQIAMLETLRGKLLQDAFGAAG